MYKILKRGSFALRNQLSQKLQFSLSKQTDLVVSSHKKLLKALQKEITYEQENYEASTTNQQVFKEIGFELKDLSNDINMELSRKVEDTDVIITFVQKSPAQIQNQEEEGEQEENYEEEEGSQQDLFDFTVYSIKGDEGLAFDCSWIQGEMQINFVTTFHNFQNFKSLNKYERAYKHYLGPDFHSLEENVQNLLQELLKNYGINTTLIQAMKNFAEDKEQRLYMQWMADLNKFLENK